MAVSWYYRIPPHEVEQWPEQSIKRVLGYGQRLDEQRKAADGNH